MNLHFSKCLWWRSFTRWLLTVWLWYIQPRTNHHIGIDEVFDSESHFSSWISPLTRYESSLSCLLPDCQPSPRSLLTASRLFCVCLFVPGPWEESGIVKGGRSEKKAIPFPGLITEAGASDMSWLKQHHFCHSCLAADLTNDAGGSRHMPLSMV